MKKAYLVFLSAILLLLAIFLGAEESAKNPVDPNGKKDGYYCSPDFDKARQGLGPWDYCDQSDDDYYYITTTGKASKNAIQSRNENMSWSTCRNAARSVALYELELKLRGKSSRKSENGFIVVDSKEPPRIKDFQIYACCPLNAKKECDARANWTNCACMSFAERPSFWSRWFDW